MATFPPTASPPFLATCPCHLSLPPDLATCCLHMSYTPVLAPVLASYVLTNSSRTSSVLATYIRTTCLHHLSSSPEFTTCPLHLSSPHVFTTCPLHLSSPPVLFTCPRHLLSSPVFPTYSRHQSSYCVSLIVSLTCLERILTVRLKGTNTSGVRHKYSLTIYSRMRGLELLRTLWPKPEIVESKELHHIEVHAHRNFLNIHVAL